MAAGTALYGDSGSATSATVRRLAVAIAGALGEQLQQAPTRPLGEREFGELLQLCEQHRLLGAFVELVQRGELPVDDTQYETLCARHTVWAVHALRIERLLVQLQPHLERAGIDCRLLKGVALAHLVYDDPAWRVFSDLDIIVPSDRLEDAVQTVSRELRGRRVLPELRPGFDREFGKDVTVRVDDVEVDIHRTLASGPVGLTVDVDCLFRTATPVEIGGCTFAALGPVDLFVHACIDVALGDYPVRLGALRDLVAVHARGALDVAEVLAVARSWRAAAVVRRAARLTCDVLGLDQRHGLRRLTDVDVSRLESLMLRTYLTSARGYTRALSSLLVIRGVRPRLRYAFAVAVPSKEYLDSRAWTRSAHVRRAVRSIGRRM